MGFGGRVLRVARVAAELAQLDLGLWLQCYWWRERRDALKHPWSGAHWSVVPVPNAVNRVFVTAQASRPRTCFTMYRIYSIPYTIYAVYSIPNMHAHIHAMFHIRMRLRYGSFGCCGWSSCRTCCRSLRNLADGSLKGRFSEAYLGAPGCLESPW